MRKVNSSEREDVFNSHPYHVIAYFTSTTLNATRVPSLHNGCTMAAAQL
jgi:hypothetical protein